MSTAPEPAAGLEAKVAEASRLQEMEARIVAAMRTCYDPEIPVNIHELGLIYGIDLTPEGAVTVRMTLTSPACPAAGSLPGDVEAKVRGVAGVTAVKIDLVWEPPWEPSRMSEAARLQLGMDDF
jgi:FeS assembly SUF system protein